MFCRSVGPGAGNEYMARWTGKVLSVLSEVNGCDKFEKKKRVLKKFNTLNLLIFFNWCGTLWGPRLKELLQLSATVHCDVAHCSCNKIGTNAPSHCKLIAILHTCASHLIAKTFKGIYLQHVTVDACTASAPELV